MMRAQTNNVIRLNFEHRTIDVPCPSFDELTVEDYVRCAETAPTYEEPHERLLRVFGLEEHVVRCMSMDEVEQVLAFYSKWMAESAAMVGKLRTIVEQFDADDTNQVKWGAAEAIAQLNDVMPLPHYLELDGTRYIVPHRVDEATVYGQYLDVRNAIRSHGDAGEVSLYPTLLAILCLPEGEAYNPSNNQHRKHVFNGARFVDALTVCAFFFSTCERLRAMLNPNFPLLARWKKHWNVPEPRNTVNAGASSTS